MKIVRSYDELKSALADLPAERSYVPTMGALHTGHLSLIELANAQPGSTIVSIFVNPTQFAPHEDFDSYPRDVESDLAQLSGVDLVYLPRVEDLYPDGATSDIKAGKSSKGLETDFRPHFFDGVCSVVYRLFNQIQPSVAVFGEKDYQQLMIIREMVEKYDLPIEIIGGPTMRDAYGLALSSRNAYLTADELDLARRFNVILRGPEPSAQKLLDAGFTSVDYVEQRWGRILGAVWLGKTRLIDNVADTR